MTDETSWKVHIVRSPRRKRTLHARLIEGGIEVLVPKGMPPDQERELVDGLVARLRERVQRAKRLGDKELMQRARELSRRYFGRTLPVTSVRFVANQEKRFGSCTPSTGTIRISDRLAKIPGWVRDYVLIHELAHLIHADHSQEFWKLVYVYELTERARGFLMGMGFAENEEEPIDATGD